MGVFNVVMEIGDPAGERFVPFSGLVDTGSTLTALPGSLLTSLGVIPERRAGFELADESVVEYSVGTASIRYNGKTAINPVVFMPDEVSPIIGLVTMETLGLKADSIDGQLVPVKFRL